MTAPISFQIQYQYRDGYHVYSSTELRGLFVAATDGKAAFEDVSKSIELLLKLDHGIQCSVIPAESYGEAASRSLAQKNNMVEQSSSVSSLFKFASRIFTAQPQPA